MIQLSRKLFIPMPHLEFFNRYICSQICRIFRCLQCPLLFLFSAFYYIILYEISATVRVVLQRQNAQNLVWVRIILGLTVHLMVQGIRCRIVLNSQDNFPICLTFQAALADVFQCEALYQFFKCVISML